MKNLFYLLFLLLHTTPLFAQTWQQLDSLGQALTKQQKLKEADSVLQIALKKVETQHGKDTSYAKVAIHAGIVLFDKGGYDKADLLYSEGRQIIEKYAGKKHRLYADACAGLAEIYRKRNFYSKAEPLCLEAKNLREALFGKKHLLYAESCNSLGILYKEQGLYNKAESAYLEAKKIREEIVGKKHEEYAFSCNNLAVLYVIQGLYNKAEEHYLICRDILKEVFGTKNPHYAFVSNNLATLYKDEGLYDKAAPLYLEAKNTRAEILGKKHTDYAESCNGLALLRTRQGTYDEAELLYTEAKGIWKEALGAKHTNYAIVCINMAALYRAKGMYSQAELFYLEAKDILLETLGRKHANYAIVCNNLASLYNHEGFYDKAEPLYWEAKNIREEVLGKKHPLYAEACNNLADLYSRKSLKAKAEPLYMEAIQNKSEQIKVLFPHLSEKEKTSYWRSIRFFFDNTIAFSQYYATQKPAVMASLYNQVLFTKGIVFSSSQKIKNAILNSGDTALISQYNNWKKQRETYTKLYQAPLDEQKKQNLNADSLKSQINELEKQLSHKSLVFGQNVQTKSYQWQEVKLKLTKNEAVVEMVKSNFGYIALFLTAHTDSLPEFLILADIKELENKYLNYYKNCIEFKIEDTVSYNAFWKPIADKLLTLNKKGFKKIYFSPDGVFHQLSLNTLKNTKTGKFLLEEANIQLIGSSRDLIELNKKSRDLSQNYENYQAHLLGYPIYGTENGEPIKNRDRAAGFSGVQSAVGVAGAVSLLPGTKKEVENVFGLFNQKKLKVNLLLAENATEEALKNLKSPTILHVATHGFFIPEIKDSEVQDMQTAMNRNLLKNPFMRSGLLLAGCQKPNPEGEDGILTAEEVMNLTLDNTELVVMSACETGLGDIQAGEGVFGLQRAFQQAGAKSVLMSLWKVDDEATQTLMTEFYTALLKGQSKRQAFKTAQMNLKKRFPEPYYWGAFVMVGE